MPLGLLRKPGLEADRRCGFCGSWGHEDQDRCGSEDVEA